MAMVQTSFQRLLSLGGSLVQRQADPSPNENAGAKVDPLSLRQLVPVYTSLCQAVLTSSTTSSLDRILVRIDEDLPQILGRIFVKDDDVISFRFLLETGTDKERLLILIFLLQHFSRCQGLALLIRGVIPSQLPQQQQQHQSTEDWTDAILDAVLARPNDEQDNNTPWLSTILAKCTATTTSIKILVRLYPLGYPVVNTLFQFVLQVMSDPEHDNAFNAITSFVLPLLYNHSQPSILTTEQTNTLWTLLSTQQRHHPLKASAIFCTILPFLLQTNLPTTRPIDQPQLWNFLYTCLTPDTMTIPKGIPGRGQQQLQDPSQLIRRRALYILRILVEQSNDNEHFAIWKKYVACFELLEMETEPHLLDQVWDTMRILLLACTAETSDTNMPKMTFDWISAMLCRLFLADTPVLRKLACFRLFTGTAGIQVGPLVVEPPSRSKNSLMLPKKKHSIKAMKRIQQAGASLSILSCDFVIDAILPSFDTLGPSIGTNMQYEENGSIQNEDLIPKAMAFLTAYVTALPSGIRIKELITAIFSPRVVCRLRTKTALMVFRAVACAERTDVKVDEDMLLMALSSFGLLFSAGSVVITFRQGLLEAFAQILSSCTSVGKIDPKTILRVLMLYPTEDSTFAKKNANKIHPHLKFWLSKMMSLSPEAVSTMGSACAAAFVAGDQLLPTTLWDPRTGSSDMERAMGAAIVLLCALTESPSSLLWPAIFKAGGTPCVFPLWHNAGKVSRSMILLEHGCRMEILSGVGNGDLVVDSTTHQMMRPPSNIEAILTNGVTFLIQHVKTLNSATVSNQGTLSGSTRSGNTNRISALLASLISQLKVLHQSYPSSVAISDASDELYVDSISHLSSASGGGIDVVTFTALAFASLSCGANPLLPIEGTSTVKICMMLLHLDFVGNDTDMSRSDEQTARSMFHYSRWGALYCILPSFLDKSTESPEILSEFLSQLFAVANDLVQATPGDALLPLFDCVIVGATTWLIASDTDDSNVYSTNLGKIISSLFDVLSDISNSETSTYMLNTICELIFRPRLLIDEAERLDRDEQYAAPIRAAFRRLMTMAGTLRAYISKAVLCRACGAWLGFETEGMPNAGVGAIPYRQDMMRLLIQKDSLIDESSTNQGVLQSGYTVPEGAVELPLKTSDSSISRGFVLVFFSSLSDIGNGISDKVVSGLLHYLIIHLLEDICLAPLKGGAMIMTGSEDYSKRIRAWQALCVLSRFVSGDIAEQVCEKVFTCMSQNLHGQIRFFIEVFTMQCARQHPSVFAKQLVVDIQRYDLTLQHISSLMIVGGNLIVGQHRLVYFDQFEDEHDARPALEKVLAGIIPWLSSTQGFSRCIAQLLVYELIPKVLDVNTVQVGEKEWYLRSLYSFLHNNSEMKRLRTKQMNFFDNYDSESACTPEGLMLIKVDESDEINPVHLVDGLKRCLEEIYLEAHEDDAPMWKQVEEMTLGQDDNLSKNDTCDDNVNFQRKIIPLDSLGLTLEEARDKQQRNASGRVRQQLIICASLIDKVPNLAGLARTAEIFAAERLVVPDIGVCKMDNFKSISVGAGEWITIEECREANLVKWLRQRKQEGYTIVGVEQTSSSVSIVDLHFTEKVVLLLGKEKEGIPVEFLQSVDVCVEIPQLGIIRSLNVHVSGAISIWEYTKQMLQR